MHDCFYCTIDFYCAFTEWATDQVSFFFLASGYFAFSAPYSSLSVTLLQYSLVVSVVYINANNFQSDCLVLNSMVTALGVLVDRCTV